MLPQIISRSRLVCLYSRYALAWCYVCFSWTVSFFPCENDSSGRRTSHHSTQGMFNTFSASGGQGVPQSIITKAAKKKTPEEGKEFIRAELKKLSEGGGTKKGKKALPIQMSSSAIVKVKDVKLETGDGGPTSDQRV